MSDIRIPSTRQRYMALSKILGALSALKMTEVDDLKDAILILRMLESEEGQILAEAVEHTLPNDVEADNE